MFEYILLGNGYGVLRCENRETEDFHVCCRPSTWQNALIMRQVIFRNASENTDRFCSTHSYSSINNVSIGTQVATKQDPVMAR